MPPSEEDLHYEVIETRARPPRVAVLIDSADEAWRHTILRILEFLSSIWGGQHSVIIPTDGRIIAEPFWRVLEKFSPDHLWCYQKTGEDIRISNPEEFELMVLTTTAEGQRHLPEFPQLEENIRSELPDAIIVPAFSLDDQLRFDIIDRIIPFHFEKSIHGITQGITPYELTKIAEVLPCVNHPTSYISFELPDIVEPVWWVARTGKYAESTLNELNSLGVHEDRIRVHENEVYDFAHWIAGGSHSLRREIAASLGTCSSFTPPDRTTKPLPFDLTMSQVGLYGRGFSWHEIRSRFALVLGDSVADFCLSYCLPKIDVPACWIPLKWIDHFSGGGSTILRSCVTSAVLASPHETRREGGLMVCTMSAEPDSINVAMEGLNKYCGPGLNLIPQDLFAPSVVVERATEVWSGPQK
jgi:hypothetical protein